VTDAVKPSRILPIARIVGAYAVVGGLWIVASDALLLRLPIDPNLHSQLSVEKGLAFVLVTAALLGYLLNRELGAREGDQAALHDSEARYRQLFNASPQPMWVFDLATLRFLAVNDAAIASYGWSRDEFMAMTVADIHPPEDVPRLGEVATQAEANEFASAGIWRHRKRDGTVIDVEVLRRGMAFGGHTAALVLAHDLTERVRAERGMRESERFTRSALDSLPASIAILDARGAIVTVNREWRQFADRHPAPPAACACEGANYLEICDRAVGEDAADARALAAGIRAVLRAQQAEFSFEYASRSPGETRWLSARVMRFVGEGPLHVVVAHLDVTERRRADLAFQQQGELLNEYVSANPCVVYALAVENGRWVPEWVSANVQSLLGYSVQEASEPGWWSRHVHPQDRATVLAVRDALRESDVARHEYRFRRSDGSWIWVHDQLRQQRDAQGQPKRIIGAWTDVTELQRARRALQASERRLRAAFEHAAVGVAHVASDGSWLDVNPRLCEILGYSRDELLELRFQDLTYPEDLERDLDQLSRLLSGEIASASTEKRYLRRGGDVVWANRTASAVLTAAGAPDYLVVVVEDISERKRAEQELHKLSLAVAQSSESIVITDLDGRIEYVNDAFVRISGFARDELVGCNPRVLQSGRTPRSTYESMWATLTQGRPWRGEFHNRRKDGSVYLEAALISPIRQPNGQVTHYVAVKEDITDKRRIAAELEQYQHRLEDIVAERTAALDDARRQAEAANRAKSAFLANMSHEIRTPMNGVLGMLEVLARGRLTEQQLETVRTAQESGRTLLAIIDDILDFSKIEAGRMQIERTPTSLLDVVEGLGDSMVPLAHRRDVDLSVFVAPEIPERVASDPLRLRQILFNLIGNAIKFSSGGSGRRGRVAVRVTMAQSEPLRIAFTVADNGIGMAPDVVDRLFVPFSQAEVSTTRRYGGTGLGLTICKRLADLMHGEIGVTSRPGEGSTFTLTLPVEALRDQPARNLADLSGIECLVVESDEFDVDGLCSYLGHAGARATRAADDTAAARVALSRRSPVVIIRSAGKPRPSAAVAAIYDLADVRQVWITRGRRRHARKDSSAVVTLDGAAMRRQALLRAVAVAAGRASPEVAPETATPAQPAVAAAPPSVAEARDRGELILVAEDDEINAKVLARQLDLLGRAAEFARDGVEALRMWRTGHYALLLTDLHMPAMDGYELAAAIRSAEAAAAPASRRVPIVALTANALRGETERARAAGIDDYLTKPLQLDLLRSALDRALRPAEATSAAGACEASGGAAVDVGVLRSHIGDDPEPVRDLLAQFLDNARKQGVELRAAGVGNDARGAATVAHKLKSSARAIGAARLGELCSEIEHAGKAGDCDGIAARIAPFDTALARVEAEIAGLLSQRAG
jgi:PAS domain S-box-containing protein